MTINDLKVENANVRVSNANEEGKVYEIAATFQTKDGKLRKVDSGNVSKEGKQIASFYTGMEYEVSRSVTYMNEATKSVEMQCEIIHLIDEFVKVSAEKAIAEANEL